MVDRRIHYGVLALVLFLVEVFIAVRLPHLNFVRGSLGDVLVVVFLYATALAIRDFDRFQLAGATFLFACVIEACQYFRLAQLLGLRPNGVLWTALGSTATWEDVVCYFVGAALALVCDLALFGRRRTRPRRGGTS